MTLHSCFYEGVVRHRRRTVQAHSFRNRLFMIYLDLDEAEEAFRDRWFWSTDRPNIAWFRRADHLGPPDQPLDESVRDLVALRLGRRPVGPIRLLTHLRYFGIAMNPISVYYCFDAEEGLDAVIAEVTNTPWNERYWYVLDARRTTAVEIEAYAAKKMHVSPFLGMDYDYRFRFVEPGEDLTFAVSNLRHGSADIDFQASLSLSRRPFDGREAARVLLRYPAMTAQVFLNIYGHAIRLWWKQVSFVPHPGHRNDAIGSDDRRSDDGLGDCNRTTMHSEAKADHLV